jgi:hypothetical protein
MDQKYYILFFNKASKRNLRVVGLGGIFYYPKGNIVATFAWAWFKPLTIKWRIMLYYEASS